MEKNKTGKYFKYAVGEIVLVVIGILIALQINNWNENRKTTLKESLILNELRKSIDNDLKSYESFLDPRLEKKKSGIDSLGFYIFENKGIQDSIFQEFYSNSKQDVFMRFDNGPFEALKSNGLELISNDSLRTAINNAYTVDLPLYKYFSNDLYDESNIKINELQYKFISLKRVYHEDGRKHLHFDLIVNDILNNKDFLWVYDLERRKLQEFNSRLKQMRTTLEELKKMINLELKK